MGLGFPISMVVFNDRIIEGTSISISHFSSHQNDPLSAVIVSYVIDHIQTNNMLKKVSEIGIEFLNRMIIESESNKTIINPRGMGLMIAFDIYQSNCANYKDTFRARHNGI